MKIPYESIKFGGHRLQSPHTAIAVDPDDLLSQTSHVAPIHIQDQPDPEAFSIKIIDFNWWKIQLENPKYDVDGQHGEMRGANTMKNRRVKIKMEIFCNDHAGAMKARNVLMDIYSPVIFPSLLNRGFRKLEFEDQTGEKWFFQAQVLGALPNFSNQIWQNKIIPVTVELIGQNDARIFSDAETEVLLEEGAVGGFDIGHTVESLGHESENAKWNSLEITNSYNWYSPVKFEIEMNDLIAIGGDHYSEEIQSFNPSLMNMTTGNIFRLDYTLTDGEKIVVDGFQNTIEVDGSVMNNLKVNGSIFLSIVQGINDFVLFDDSHPSVYGKGIKGKVFYRKVMI